jgi:hypothetical protein
LISFSLASRMACLVTERMASCGKTLSISYPGCPQSSLMPECPADRVRSLGHGPSPLHNAQLTLQRYRKPSISSIRNW